MGFASPAQLFDASWTAHRLSPLYHNKDHQTLIGNADALITYAKRFHDVLAGDVLRGVQGTTAVSDALTKAGSLIDCRWEHTPTFDYWDDNLEEDRDSPIEPKNTLGILVTIDYENITYRAALLAGPDGYTPTSTDRRRKQSTYLPILLTRMPNMLRQTFTQFLSSTFDAYCSVLRLPSDFLCTTLEAYISSLTSGESSTSTSKEILELALKETQLTLSFGQPVAPALKAIDIALPRETLSAFALDNDTSSFSASLSHYLERHLAMDVKLGYSKDLNGKSITNRYVWLSKVANGAFVLTTEGRFKLVDMSNRHMDSLDEQEHVHQKIISASEQILRSLVQRAIGDDMAS
ncbi:kinetochore complex Sim4 subunit Fta1-domain-containing protein [Talaromyces proteolyticus]|uniref:Kinetochore complex Sim4 subunit Fta1-domain-containing protein n=1 Tax=Talaromyces proteolyticus TaxID=1131652 RepID=A0AAD4KKM5_9EURO|nr:kinetochore complex Sim4 subunit Fta1-domain-containing protein [Talaromyces proteolyticus]KAH8694983.1 kinetochore complex Sim4 subunit Fta1-domain-containing protein [Talaromyces proteolyticus]